MKARWIGLIVWSMLLAACADAPTVAPTATRLAPVATRVTPIATFDKPTVTLATPLPTAQYIEIEVDYAGELYVGHLEWVLCIGDQEFVKWGNYPHSFLLTPAEFASLPDGDPVALRYGGCQGSRDKSFGSLDKSKLSNGKLKLYEQR